MHLKIFLVYIIIKQHFQFVKLATEKLRLAITGCKN